LIERHAARLADARHRAARSIPAVTAAEQGQAVRRPTAYRGWRTAGAPPV
jgi:hypothetical protein